MPKKAGTSRSTKPRRSSESSSAAAAQAGTADDRSQAFPIVAVSAAAGGLDPFLEIVQHLPPRPGLAFVIVLDDDADQGKTIQSMAAATSMPVLPVADGARVERNRIYVASRDVEVTIANGVLGVRNPDGHASADSFFRSLAADQGPAAIGVVLSGGDADGTAGAAAIRAEGGLNFAQDDTARHQRMPHSAIASGAIDYVLSPANIAAELLNVGTVLDRPHVRLPQREANEIFQLLQSTFDVDFAHYKAATIERRIRRRMIMHRIDDPAQYVRLLRENPQELEQLYGDVLIRVTGFFRDPEVFEVLRRDVIPGLLENRSLIDPVRVWVAGCSTGEEVYSLAMTFFEAAGERNRGCPLQIFATDISDAALDWARAGAYPESAVENVSPERLRRFFTETEDGYRVVKAVRDCCVFARQNVTKDPPFSRVDLVSCRNVLIYLGLALQRKVMSLFHYALRPDGYLLLGSSESVGSCGDLFSVADRKHKIYRKKNVQRRPALSFEPLGGARERTERVRTRMDETNAPVPNIFRDADRAIVSRFSPPGVVIDERYEIVQFRGRTSQFLEPASGAASFNVLKMAREGLLADLRTAVHAARKNLEPVRREGVRVKTNGATTLVNLEVLPFITAAKERYCIVLFEEAVPPAGAGKSTKKEKAPTAAEQRTAARLERELDATREYLQSIIEQQEVMNEELRSANEEIQSSNEELQSTNEELETAKEELQSTNEELTTLNEELESRNQELAEANNDLLNLLSAVDLGIVMLDRSMRIRRFNPAAQRTLNLIPGDIGRPIHDLKLTTQVADLEQLIADAIGNLEVREVEVQDRRGKWYLLRVRPYKTMDNKIEGAVLVLIDVDQLKRAATGSVNAS